VQETVPYGRASESPLVHLLIYARQKLTCLVQVWESEEWLKQNVKPVGRAGVGSLNPGNQERKEVPEGDDEGQAMEE